MNIKILRGVICICLTSLLSCVNHDLTEPELAGCENLISFANDIKPIIDRSCAIPNCHNGDNGADINWTVFSNFHGKRANVRDRITRPLGTPGRMPLVGEITQDEIQLIVCWVDQGGINN